MKMRNLFLALPSMIRSIKVSRLGIAAGYSAESSSASVMASFQGQRFLQFFGFPQTLSARLALLIRRRSGSLRSLQQVHFPANHLSLNLLRIITTLVLRD